jgi:hypothetical protein
MTRITRMHVLAPVADMVNHDDKMRKVSTLFNLFGGLQKKQPRRNSDCLPQSLFFLM